jgi:hypothetical protein
MSIDGKACIAGIYEHPTRHRQRKNSRLTARQSQFHADMIRFSAVRTGSRTTYGADLACPPVPRNVNCAVFC